MSADPAKLCTRCRGTNGFHYMGCPEMSAGDGGEQDAPVGHKTPPSAETLVGASLVWLVARTCHEALRAYSLSAADAGDRALAEWDDAPAEQRESCYEGVMRFVENPQISERELHDEWVQFKVARGWKYGPVKDETRKEHPCILPYHELRLADRVKDAIFANICRSLLGRGS